ncbi:MAG: S-layer homology domain-containing protein [Clostridia bacterium]|nr:S-layer homology domain-containing protein [Clostridia bacterium]
MLKKKFIVVCISVAMLAGTAPVMAAENTAPPQMPQSAQGTPPEKPDGDMPEGERPSGQMPGGEKLPFSDVSDSAWYYNIVSRAYYMNLIKGMSDTEFSPESSVTGAQLVTMLYRAAGNETSDISGGNWYDETVNWAEENGIVKSDNGWNFEPNDELTREQMMVLLYNYMLFKGESSTEGADLSKFSDSSDISDWAKPAIEWLVEKGYIEGDGETLRPLSSLTRAETATILLRSMGENTDISNQSDMTPPDKPDGEGGQNGGAPGGFGGSSTVTQGTSANTISDNGTYSDKTYISTGDDENALRVDGATVTLDSIIVDKASGTTSNTENGDFYGQNAALLATNGAQVTIKNANITSAAQNGNGVFSYGTGTVVNISDSVITTSADNSGGIQTTGGGTTNANNLTVTTSGSSSAAIRSDRGGGTVNVDGGTYTSNGNNSPAVYSTADITVSNATLTANNSEALVIEGKNSITLNNSTVEGKMSKNGSSADENMHNVMIYQSMSGDADVGTSEFTMNGGTLTGNSGDMIYVTNTHSIIKLCDVTIVNNDADGALLRVVGNSASRGWGTAGANGAQVEFTADNQTLDGDIVVDTISTLDLTLSNGSVLNGAVNIIENAQNGSAVSNNAVVTIDNGCVWNLTGDCTITSLTNNGTINFNGHTITLSDGTVLSK